MARLTIEELATAIGVTRQAVSGWENGHTSPTDDNLAGLRSVLGASFGQVADATFSQLQRLHGRSEELEALQRYVMERQAELTRALADATSQPYARTEPGHIEERATLRPPSTLRRKNGGE